MSRSLVVVGSLMLAAGAALADAEASGTITWQGKSITYKISGASAANGSSSADDDKCVLRLDLDGTKHELVVTKAGLEYQGTKVPLDSFKKVELTGDATKVRILVDGREVSFKDKK
jgi:hypothetical protein